jgi:hypothetical protein
MVCSKLKLLFQEVWSDADLTKICQNYIQQGEIVFAAVQNDFDSETYATLIQRKKATRTSIDRYVAVVDCRGEKAHRRFFTKWHEIAHLLTINQQLEFRLHRSRNDQSPGERLMDTIAGRVGFYGPLFDPILENELALAGRLTFEGVERVRTRFASDASYTATLYPCLRKCASPTILLECGIGYKKDEERQLLSGQSLLLPEEPPTAKLRLLNIHRSQAKSRFTFHKNMSVPPASLISQCQELLKDETRSGEENLQIWRHGDGRCLGHFRVRLEIRKMNDRLLVLVTEL